MNELVVKRSAIFSLLLGAVLGLAELLPFLIGNVLFALSFFSSVIIILFMKKNDKHLGFIDTKEGAILGGIIGFLSTIGFFLTFSPMVCILRLILKERYYSYAIPEAFSMGLWLFAIIVLMVAGTFALTNSATGMGVAFGLSYFEKPQNPDARLDIKIED